MKILAIAEKLLYSRQSTSSMATNLQLIKTNTFLNKMGVKDVLQSLSKFPHADWLVAIVYKSTDNKMTSDVTRALSQRKT